MPNHVTNRITFTGSVEDVAAAKALLIVEDTTASITQHEDGSASLDPNAQMIDFNGVIPMDPLLNKVVVPVKFGPNNRVMLKANDSELIPWKDADYVEATEQEHNLLAAIGLPGDNSFIGALNKAFERTNFPNWYDWSVDNWGTKWNGYSFNEISNEAHYEFSFDTAWSPPTPVFDEIARRFPNLKLGISWFDEGWCHAGDGVLQASDGFASSDSLSVEPNDEVYEKVYGENPEALAIASSMQFFADYPSPYYLRIADNGTCYDVAAAMDDTGGFTLTYIHEEDDPQFGDADLYALRQVRNQIAEKLGVIE